MRAQNVKDIGRIVDTSLGTALLRDVNLRTHEGNRVHLVQFNYSDPGLFRITGEGLLQLQVLKNRPHYMGMENCAYVTEYEISSEKLDVEPDHWFKLVFALVVCFALVGLGSLGWYIYTHL